MAGFEVATEEPRDSVIAVISNGLRTCVVTAQKVPDLLLANHTSIEYRLRCRKARSAA